VCRTEKKESEGEGDRYVLFVKLKKAQSLFGWMLIEQWDYKFVLYECNCLFQWGGGEKENAALSEEQTKANGANRTRDGANR